MGHVHVYVHRRQAERWEIDALDQLLSYASWRDSKLAVIVFNRRKDFSSVLATIPEAARSHPQFKRQLEYSAEGACRFIFGQKDDRNRDLMITVVAFDVPAAGQADPRVEEPPAAPRGPRPAPSTRATRVATPPRAAPARARRK